MPNSPMLTFLLAAVALAPGAALGQGAMELAIAGPQPHFVAAWAPKKEREAERSSVLAGRVSLELRDVALDAALKALTNQAGLRITYSRAMLPAGRRVTISASDIAVVTAMTEMLFRSGLDVVVDRDGALALVPCAHPVAREIKSQIQDTGAIVGRVTDKATGNPIVGATVVAEGTGRSATSGADGRFRIGGLEARTYALRARYIGFAALVTSATVISGGESVVEFALDKSVQQLDEVVTTGTMVPTEVRALPAPISVITEGDIAARRPSTVQEMFRQAVPGAVSWDIGGAPYYTAFSVRGTSTLASTPQGQMKVFVDGIETALTSVAGVDPRSIERMEVLRGPQAAAIYGSEAIGGVIQIFSKRGDLTLRRTEVESEATVGMIQTPYAGVDGVVRQSYSGSIRGVGPLASYNLGAGYSHTGDWLPNGEISAQSSPSVYGGMRFAQGIITVDVSGRYYTQNYGGLANPQLSRSGLPFFTKPSYLPQQTQNLTVGARLDIAPSPWWRNEVMVGTDRYTLGYAQTQPRLTTPEDTLLQVLDQRQTKTSIRYTTSVSRDLAPTVSGSLTAGFDHWSLPVSTWSAFNAVTTTGAIATAPGTAISASRSITNNTGYFAQVQIGVRQSLFLTGGVRAERNSNLGDSLGTPVSPRVGLSYVQTVGKASLKLRGSWGRAIRAPDPGLKLGGTSAGVFVTLPNPDLGPERQEGWDAGVDVDFGAHGSASATYYDQIADNLLQEVQLQSVPVPTSQWQNVGSVKNTGVELEARVVLGPAALRGQYGYRQSRIGRLAPGYTGDLQIAEQALVTPKHTAGLSLVVTPNDRTSASAGLTYVGSWRNYDNVALFSCFGGTRACPSSFPASTRGFIVPYPSILKLNIMAVQRIRRSVSAFASVVNLTNTTVAEVDNVYAVMGRITTIGLRFQH